MKAQFIYENIDFERNIDPLKAMDVGRHRKIKKGDVVEVYNSNGIKYLLTACDDEFYSKFSKKFNQHRIIYIQAPSTSNSWHWTAEYNETTERWELDNEYRIQK